MTDAANTAFVVLFARFKSKQTGTTSEWTSIGMQPSGIPGIYVHDLVSTEMKAVKLFENAWVQYQLVATDADSEQVGRTDIFDERLTFAGMCSHPHPDSIHYAHCAGAMMNFPPELIHFLKKAARVAVLTGAGVSQESGLRTFRDAQSGLWAQYRPEDLATPSAFARDPKLVWDWYSHRRQQREARIQTRVIMPWWKWRGKSRSLHSSHKMWMGCITRREANIFWNCMATS